MLLIHDWMGVSDHQKDQVQQLAALGYVALAANVYGKGVRPANVQEAGAEAGKWYKNRGQLRARMRAGGVDWQLVQYSGAVHSLTDPRAGNDNSKGAAYNASADRRSWRAMRDFFEETLK